MHPCSSVQVMHSYFSVFSSSSLSGTPPLVLPLFSPVCTSAGSLAFYLDYLTMSTRSRYEKVSRSLSRVACVKFTCLVLVFDSSDPPRLYTGTDSHFRTTNQIRCNSGI
ncbi:hypothetical protein CC80DRAFT_30247 [Byssothecium circinans]|uniref:Uncharacterized protein n=1 Tax=Byssothecium circinans TaxID=147558 RepID=A0A6A5U365_9PLEO|nr:hypothetical protein CC80DRAFT_30247 [Byssothecium circinans]